MVKTLGQYLFDSALPAGVKFSGPVDKKAVEKALGEFAKKDPYTYAQIVTELKRLGDEVATYEGISVGLDDIAPHYKTRDPILKSALEQIKKTHSADERRKIILATQNKIRAAAGDHPGDMTLMAKSGGRGNFNQYMKTVASPVGVTKSDGTTNPWLIARSYSEGLRPSEYWAAADEARQNAVEGKIQVTEPGVVGKKLIQTMIDQVVTDVDCGTHNGIAIPAHDQKDMVDRFLAKPFAGFEYNTLITSQVAREIAKHPGVVIVRSPMTCAHNNTGVCAKCMGLSERGQQHSIGTNVGVRSAQGMSEPLTQMTLSAKHSTRMAGDKTQLTGLQAVQAFINVPKVFPFSATLAQIAGKVTAVKTAPQGGHYVVIESTEHYVPPDLKVKVHPQDTVEAGDALSTGVAKPDEVVRLKGMGHGRKYFVDSMHHAFKDAGVDIDKRHIELLARAQLNHVEIVDDPDEEFLPSDIVPFPRVRERLERDKERVPVAKAEGRVLAHDYLHYTAGTTVTPSLVKDLQTQFKEVEVSKSPLKFNFSMHPIDQVPLLRGDWMARLSHQHIKGSIIEGASEAQESDIHGLHPVPGYVYGLEFGHNDAGHY